MSKVSIMMSMSLDGFIAGPNDEIDPLHDWLFSTRPAAGRGVDGWADKAGGDREKFFGPVGVNKEILNAGMDSVGAVIVGRRTYDLTHGWRGVTPTPTPHFVVSHTVPDETYPAFTYVTDGIESVHRQAQAAAGGKMIGLMGASIIQQFIKAGLLDEVGIQLIPVLLGRGISLFGTLDIAPVMLERDRVVEGPDGVTHLWFTVKK